ncbi:MAG: hypothetical protein O6951_07010 [Actinobacteria bacterium]|nr:hypothetical protein [Actinomycetota bacterium]
MPKIPKLTPRAKENEGGFVSLIGDTGVDHDGSHVGGHGFRPLPESGLTPMSERRRLIDLSHPIRDGMITYPRLPNHD